MKGRVRIKTEKRNRKKIFGLGTFAATLILVLFVGTTPGHAAIERIREFFAPEKPIVEEIEGIKEEKNVQLQESNLGYIIYIDEEIFILEALETKDRIVPKNPATNLPEVYMEIEQIVDRDVETLGIEIEKELKQEYETVINEQVESPLEAILLYGQKGFKWDDVVVRYYLVDNTKGGSFVIKQHFFFEASEGYGARYDNMLQEFKIVKLEE